MNDDFLKLLSLIPEPDGEIDWAGLQGSALRPYLQRMADTPQNPVWHGEGDVLAHTKMVCERLVQSRAWLDLGRRGQQALFLAALMHDIGKPAATRLVSGAYTSPHHASIGEKLVRAMLWRDLGVGGTAESQGFRETICALIRHHAKPFHFLDAEIPQRRVIELSSIGALASDFRCEMLSALTEADIRGRIFGECEDRLLNVRYFREVCAELDCANHPYPFPSAYSRYAYLAGRNIAPGQDLYDDTWGTVILLSGLPGTGKDTFIAQHYADHPMVSLDQLRKELSISPVGPQGAVVTAALNQAKVHLRAQTPFVWNATNITQRTRAKLIRTFLAYGASVKILFLETAFDEQLKRNQSRRDVVPEPVIEKMLANFQPPYLDEAPEVEWKIS